MKELNQTRRSWHWDEYADELVEENGKRVLRCLFGSIEVSESNKKLIAAALELLDELMNYCAECKGDGAERCPYYSKDGDMCRMAQDGTCDTWMTICKAAGHDPATPWEVRK